MDPIFARLTNDKYINRICDTSKQWQLLRSAVESWYVRTQMSKECIVGNVIRREFLHEQQYQKYAMATLT